MRLTKQQSAILEALGERKLASATDLAARLRAAEDLVREDLGVLEGSGLVHRSHDGARILIASSPANRKAQAAKARIAHAALGCVEDGDTLFLDSGTTVTLFAEHLASRKHLTVITNSPPVLACLGPLADTKVVLIGGEYSPVDRCCVGALTERYLERIFVSKAIMGADSIDAETGGVFARVRHFGYIQAIVRNAKRTILLAESGKFNQIRGLKILDLDHIDTIVTDGGLPTTVREALGRYGVSLLIAGHTTGRNT